MIRVTHFCTLRESENTRTCENCTLQKRATKSDTSGHCIGFEAILVSKCQFELRTQQWAMTHSLSICFGCLGQTSLRQSRFLHVAQTLCGRSREEDVFIRQGQSLMTKNLLLTDYVVLD